MESKNKEVNKAILAMLKTKSEDIKQIEDLSKKKAEQLKTVTELGLEIADDGDSVQGYVTIKNPETNRSLLISKGYDELTHIYGNGVAINPERKFNELVKNFDFLGYLTKPYMPSNKRDDGLTNVQRYKIKKRDYNHYRKMVEQYRKEIDEKQKMLEMYEKSLESSEESLKKFFEK